MRSIILIIISLLVLNQKVYSQQYAEGSVRNSTDAMIPYVTVSLMDTNQKVIKSLRADSKGHFKIEIAKELNRDSLFLEFKHIAYVTQRVELSSPSAVYAVKMIDKPISLDEVQVKSKPRIRQNGDTTTYKMGSFTSAEDRNIGDAIRRMPGMEVDDAGVIKYNGRTVSNMYIDGDDLLNEGYGIGTRTIKPQMIEDLEVIQGHEHRKVKQGLSKSDEVAINLKVKEDAKLKWSGQVRLGAGLPYGVETDNNAMTFNKKFKTLNNLQGNTVGDDMAKEVTATHSFDLTSATSAGSPAIPLNRYNKNHSLAVNLNNLYNLNKNWQLKNNVNLWGDRVNRQSSILQNYRIDDQLISYDDRIETKSRSMYGHISLGLESNTDNYFFKDYLAFKAGSLRDNSFITNNNNDFFQQDRDQSYRFSNSLEYMPKLRNKHVLTVYSNVFAGRHKENLSVSPGIMTDILNADNPYKEVRQQVNTPELSFHTGASYTVPGRFINQEYKVDYQYKDIRLESDLRLADLDEQIRPVTGFVDNTFRWKENVVELSGTWNAKIKKSEFQVRLPVQYGRWNLADPNFDFRDVENRIFFNPIASFKQYIYNKDYINLSYSLRNVTGAIDNIYKGKILVNFRDLIANDARFDVRKQQNMTIDYSFQRPLEMLYMNASVSYSQMNANNIVSRNLTPSGIQSVFIPLKNKMNTLNSNVGISKYFSELKTSTSFKSAYNITHYNQLLNAQLLPYQNAELIVEPTVEFKGIQGVTLSYKSVWTMSKNTVDEELAAASAFDSKNQLWVNNLSMTYVPFFNFFVKGSVAHRKLEQTNLKSIQNTFLDMNIRYKVPKWKMEFELEMRNLSNIKMYESYSISAVQESISRYPLNGRLSLFRMSYLF
ncbi:MULTISPECIES: carboxypeptidase-like regulatory domain-containing protein [unclassified Sphingobacterium]|uniref:TonB-dependent receptor n=1 Tax=unclassified Sphingobacterium TaxID=2609468 RepID=UPI0025FF8632|nr:MULTISPECIES: carboxypeptidase-like regulatory domain-containing protein [unclassified Sphingobacterium]